MEKPVTARLRARATSTILRFHRPRSSTPNRRAPAAARPDSPARSKTPAPSARPRTGATTLLTAAASRLCTRRWNEDSMTPGSSRRRAGRPRPGLVRPGWFNCGRGGTGSKGNRSHHSLPRDRPIRLTPSSSPCFGLHCLLSQPGICFTRADPGSGSARAGQLAGTQKLMRSTN